MVNDSCTAGDICALLRRDHEDAVRELEALRLDVALRLDSDAGGWQARLRRLRRSWVIHTLAKEAVVYRAMQRASPDERTDVRFIEHRALVGLLDELARTPPGSVEWNEQLEALRGMIVRHLESEQAGTFARLSKQFDAVALRRMGDLFRDVRRKLALLDPSKST